MLHLLDPISYELSKEKLFRKKLERREDIRNISTSLNSEYYHFVIEDLNKLCNEISGDTVLSSLNSQLNHLSEENIPDKLSIEEILEKLRIHLSEVYQLDRRIIRNRRKRVERLTPDRAGEKALSFEGSSSEMERELEQWRLQVFEEPTSLEQNKNFFWKLLDSIHSNPLEVEKLCNQYLSTSDPESITYKQITKILNLVAVDQWHTERTELLFEELRKKIDSGYTIIVFCSQTIVADTFQEKLPADLRMVSSRFVLDDSIVDYREEKLIVCDKSAEEGLNFQGKKRIIVHFDLPLNTNRLEQRTGRVDRFGSGDPIESMLIVCNDSSYLERIYQLHKIVGVFSNSCSDLQYVIDDIVNELMTQVFKEGIDYFDDLLAKVSERVENERDRIKQDEQIDDLIQDNASENDFNNLIEYDANWRSINEATIDWAKNVLGFRVLTGDDNKNINEIPVFKLSAQELEEVFRFMYRKPNPEKNKRGTLIPLSTFKEKFMTAIDSEYNKSVQTVPYFLIEF